MATEYIPGWQPLPADLGARISQYRCCLPALAEFSTYRREGPTRATIEKVAEREGFEPSVRF